MPCHLYARAAVKEISRNFWAACPTSAHSEIAELEQVANSSFTVQINALYLHVIYKKHESNSSLKLGKHLHVSGFPAEKFTLHVL